MRKLLLTLVMASFFTTPAAAFYTIDGDVSDWGINLSEANTAGYLNTHLPSGGNGIDVKTEDNVDATTGFHYVGPGYSQGNLYDAEAMYFDNDNYYAYVAVITGTPQTGSTYESGDLFFDTVYWANHHYRYGINTRTGQFYKATDWEDVVFADHSDANIWRIEDGTIPAGSDQVEFVYSSEQNSHYVMEAKIPLFLFGITTYPGMEPKKLYVHWTMECGNDYLNLKGYVTHHAPEPASMALLASGLVGLFGLRRKT
jgi:hypothetical protein